MIKFENKTNGRFYYLCVEKDDDNTSRLCVFYGGRRVHRSRVALFEDRTILQREVEKITRRRLQRGYSLVA